MQELEELIGTVDHVIFHNEVNGFTIFVLQTATAQKTTIKAHTATLHAGQQVTLYGSWIKHPKFGKQFDAKQCAIILPSSTIGIQKYLSSGMIKGIGPVYAEKLVKKFGDTALEIIDKHPYRLKEVPGIGAKRIDRIIAAWQQQKEISHIMIFLQEKSISPTYAVKIYKKYGNDAIAKLQENPYKLADDIWGIGFRTADVIAKNMGIAHDSIKRITSGILYSLSTLVNKGNLYAKLSELKEKTLALLELEQNESYLHKIKLALHDLYNSERIKLITYENEHYISLATHYHSEQGISQKLKRLSQEPSKLNFNIAKIKQKLEETHTEITLNDQQKLGILSCLQNKISIITGGPGTGKTTLIQALLTTLDNHQVRYKLAAPTGRATKRMTESTQRPATTLHRLLEFDVSIMNFKHNESNALHLDFLIIDEASMIDLFLMYAMLKALPFHAHLVLIGDIDQLPSVGPGNILHDLITSNIISTTRLMTIFRQAQDSLIILNAHRINKGEFPLTFVPNCIHDFFFIKENNPEMIPQYLQKIYINLLKKHAISPAQSIVLTPMNRGNVGTIVLNDLLQGLLNPPTTQKEYRHGGTIFRIGDRVMQIKNNYDKLVFNGDMGHIEYIDLIDQIITVRFLDQTVNYEINDLDELVLAYAISIHKSQGSEFDAVIIPIFMQHFTLLQRNLIYTALTRAKKLCIFIGQPKAIGMAIHNTKGSERITFLSQFLTSNLQCR